jgi:hypothetical protein
MSHQDKAWQDSFNTQEIIPIDHIVYSSKLRLVKLLNLNPEIEYNHEENSFSVSILDTPGAIAWDLKKKKATESAEMIAFEYIADQILYEDFALFKRRIFH